MIDWGSWLFTKSAGYRSSQCSGGSAQGKHGACFLRVDNVISVPLAGNFGAYVRVRLRYRFVNKGVDHKSVVRSLACGCY